jgi:hypothetical protein
MPARCAARTCNRRVSRGSTLRICDRCWKLIPPAVQDAYIRERDAAHVYGQDATVGMLAAMSDCLTAVNGGAR